MLGAVTRLFSKKMLTWFFLFYDFQFYDLYTCWEVPILEKSFLRKMSDQIEEKVEEMAIEEPVEEENVAEGGDANQTAAAKKKKKKKKKKKPAADNAENEGQF